MLFTAILALLILPMLVSVYVHLHVHHFLRGVLISSAVNGTMVAALAVGVFGPYLHPLPGGMFLFAALGYAVSIGCLVGLPFAQWRAHPPGHCRRCGYDLTANESGVCPECGVSLGRSGSRAPGQSPTPAPE